MKTWLAILLLPLLLFGCGYTPVALEPGLEVDSLFIEPMENRTPEPFLDSLLTNSLVDRFGRDSRIRLVRNREDAEAVLSGTISEYRRRAIAYSRDDDIREYRSHMRVEAVLRRVSDGRILWKDSLSWTDELMNSSDRSEQEDNETLTIQAISERLADHLYHRLHGKF